MSRFAASTHDRAARARRLARMRRRRNERGIALVMVMGAIAVLAVMLADFQDDASAEFASATADRDSVQAEYMARSAVNLSRLLIATEPSLRQSIAPIFMLLTKRPPPQLPVWNFSDRLLGAFNDAEGSADFARTTGIDLSLGKNLGMPGGRFEVTIVDEDAKINANLGASNDIAHIRLGKELMGLMGPPQFNSLFEQKDSTGNFHDRLSICQAIIDWADVDERAFSCDMTQQTAGGGGGVEGAWYQQLPKPYRMKNAPYDSLEELRMARGVGDDFWATFVDPASDDPRKRVVTVWGQGKVNVNTANAQTLLGLVCAGAPLAEICTDIQQAQTFLMGVTMARGISMGAPLFASTKDFVAAMKGEGMLGPILKTFGMKPVKFQSEADFSNSITIESKMFSIYAVGVVKGYKRETRTSIHAVVDFRNAPRPDQQQSTLLGGTAGTVGSPGSPGSPAIGQPGGTAGTPGTPGAAGAASEFAAAMRPSTGGSIVYYRVQ